MHTVDSARVAALMARERQRFVDEHPRSRELHEQASHSLLSGVPMNWMTDDALAGRFPGFCR